MIVKMNGIVLLKKKILKTPQKKLIKLKSQSKLIKYNQRLMKNINKITVSVKIVIFFELYKK